MRAHMAAIKTIAVLAIITALGGAALGADSLATASGSDESNTSGSAGMTAAGHASAKVELPDVAAGVIAALVGGSNPSTDLSRKGSNDHASANSSHDTVNANKDKVDNDNEAADNENEVADNENEVEDAHDVAPTGTSTTKPGFGCGDTNHKHSGPPGRPGATLPPGCTKH